MEYFRLGKHWAMNIYTRVCVFKTWFIIFEEDLKMLAIVTLTRSAITPL